MHVSLAKLLFGQLSENTYCLAFRAEEFAFGHIDNTLSNTTAAISAERLFAILSGHGRIAIFVESVERLLESPVRDAFSDLLRLVSKYTNLKLILTCRDYSIATIQSSLLEPNNLAHDVIEVPPLTNDELDQVAQDNENIAAALKNGRMKELLRLLSLEGFEKTLVANLSGGMMKRANLLISLIHKPKLLILDEPTGGLDPLLRNSLWAYIKDVNKTGTTIIVASHLIDEMEENCKRVAIMKNGKIISIGAPAQYRKHYRNKSLSEIFQNFLKKV